ncbi:TOBE domain-containing protein [Robbsia sp. KACC 23696]|uniref:TOBE domain-containing protein n=1 Tax=Robbsia sp. KACC 23696 TaxID=3149231 RepID=UPI00325B83F1
MKTSARNCFAGVISQIVTGAVNDEVSIRIGPQDGGASWTVVAVITRGSTAALGLADGVAAYALIKASSVIVMVDVDPAKISTRNVFTGVISHLTPGAVNTEVVITAHGVDVAAIVTNDSATRLGLRVGGTASAAVKASSVIVAVD